MLITKPSCLAPALLALAACGSTSVEPEPSAPADDPIAPAAARGSEPMTDESAFALWHAGAERLLADPRDAGLRRAFALLDDRLIELAEENATAERALGLFAAAMAGPLTLRVDAAGTGPLPVHAQLEVGGGSPAGAAVLERELERFLVDVGIGGLQDARPPLDQLEHRVVGDGADARVVLSLGELDTRPVGLGSLDLPAGVEPTVAMKLDFRRAQPLIEMALAGEPDAEPLLQLMTALGFFGENAMAVHWAFGASDGVGHVATRTRNYVPAMEASGGLERLPITADEIGLIPADALSATITQYDPAMLLGMLELFREPMGGDPVEMIHAMTGLHPRRDVFDHLGTTCGWYTSDSTGGGGLMSLVAFLEVVNEDDLRATLDHALTALNDMAAMKADGRVETRDWMHGEGLCTTLTFPGLPVPIELSFAIDDGFLFFTLSPQALAAALDQRASRGPGLAANAAFRSAARGSIDDLVTLAYSDTPRRARDGYGLATLLTAALANAVRAPEDSGRDPGIVLPAYLTLRGPSQASVTLGRLEGDDLVQIGTCDPSMAANLAAACGSPLVYYFVGVGMAALIPAGMMMMPMMMGAPAEPYVYTEDDWEWHEFEDEAFEMSDDEAELLRLLDEMGEPDASEETTDDVLEQLRALGYVGEEEAVEEAVEEPLEETEASETDDAEEPATEEPAETEDAEEPAETEKP